MTKELPADPENMNDNRAEYAGAALRHFQCVTGGDYEDALGDLLCNLMHWSDRNNFDFEAALDRARFHYEAETAEDAPERRAALQWLLDDMEAAGETRNKETGDEYDSVVHARAALAKARQR